MDDGNSSAKSRPNEPALNLFLSMAEFEQGKLYIAVPAAMGVTHPYDDNNRFLTLTIDDQSKFFRAYGGEQSQYNHRMGEVAIAMSRLLAERQASRTELRAGFDGYTGSIPCVQKYKELLQILCNNGQTACEEFIGYLAFHRHVMAFAAGNGLNNDFGKDRYAPYLAQGRTDSYLQTNISRGPYAHSWMAIQQRSDRPTGLLWVMFKEQKIDCNAITPVGMLYNGYVVQFREIYQHMNMLFQEIVTGSLPPARMFLRRVFEIQYWFIWLMPYSRGSLAVMNMFRYVMLAYYNRRQPDGTRRLPLAPSSPGIYPDLYALMMCGSPEEFIELSMSTLYCVNYHQYCG